MLTVIPPLPWPAAIDSMLDLAEDDLAVGSLPPARLMAYDGDTAVGVAQLRPHGDDVLPPLVELLALFLPLGTDRVVLALTGRAWSLDDPIPPVTDDGDLRQRVLFVLSADAHGGGCRLSSQLHPLEPVEDGRWRFGAACAPPDEPEGRTGEAVRALLEEGPHRFRDTAPHQVASQFARVLLLGHLVAVTEERAGALLQDTAAVP